MSKIFTAGSLALLLCASLAAQAPNTQTPSPRPSAPPIAQPTTGADTPQPPTAAPTQSAARSSSSADTIVVEGCIQPSVNAVSATPDAVGTAGSVSTATAFILVSAMKPAGTSGSTASSSLPVASTYQLDVEDSKLIPHVGHKVEISGTLKSPDKSASTAASSAPGAMPAPTLKVTNVKMIAATCTP